MKKYFYLVLILPLLFSSCKKDDQNAIRGTWVFKSLSLTISPPNAELEKILNEETKENFEKFEVRFHEDNSYSILIPGELEGLSITGEYSYEKQTLILKGQLFNDGELKASASIINKGKSLKIKIDDAKDLKISDDDSDDESEPLIGVEKVTLELIFDKK